MFIVEVRHVIVEVRHVIVGVGHVFSFIQEGEACYGRSRKARHFISGRQGMLW
jgi:hypothetical protein